MVEYKILYSKLALKDAKKLSSAYLDKKANRRLNTRCNIQKNLGLNYKMSNKSMEPIKR